MITTLGLDADDTLWHNEGNLYFIPYAIRVC